MLFKMSQTTKIVFSDVRYIVLASAIFVGMLMPLLIISEFIFLEPYVIIHVPAEGFFGFALIVAVSSMAGLVLSMNVYRIRALRNKKRKMGNGIIGSIIGASAGACSCGPIGFALISTFGVAGGVATAFLTNYEIPLRLAALAILVVTYFTTRKALVDECKIKN